ncbi:GGDEF domain-containing protein [Cohnella pontilimi]|uniref:GGDEF domain-containing protein n=1 Tax=Cohnella pontilimi TaxID=2564100 RepID=A0A4U0FFW9_9BACL|nr:GGDEF domain-containing protein [Cohnella pontilimi]TJY42262.1 GGDEF domain-containing protein [Cohnella pontilimi]
MDEQEFLQRNMAEWRRRIMNSLWICAGLYLIAQLASLFLLPDSVYPNFLTKGLIPSTCWMMLILCACELAVFLSMPGVDYYLMTGMSLAASVAIWFHHDVQSVMLVIMIPLVVSHIFYNRKLSLYVFILSEALLVAVYSLNPAWRNQGLTFDLITVFILQIGVMVILLQILKRNRQVVRFLRETTASNRMLIEQNVEMNRITKLDGLTGLYNHVAFHDYLDHLIGYAPQLGVPPVLAIIDIDNFKTINDSYGHQAGDAALRILAEVISKELTPDDFAARYGGEEFALVLVDRSLPTAIETLEKIRSSIVRTNIPEIGNSAVSVSIGVEPFAPAYTKYEWFQAADSLLYQAKRSGKNMTSSRAVSGENLAEG